MDLITNINKSHNAMIYIINSGYDVVHIMKVKLCWTGRERYNLFTFIIVIDKYICVIYQELRYWVHWLGGFLKSAELSTENLKLTNFEIKWKECGWNSFSFVSLLL